MAAVVALKLSRDKREVCLFFNEVMSFLHYRITIDAVGSIRLISVVHCEVAHTTKKLHCRECAGKGKVPLSVDVLARTGLHCGRTIGMRGEQHLAVAVGRVMERVLQTPEKRTVAKVGLS